MRIGKVPKYARLERQRPRGGFGAIRCDRHAPYDPPRCVGLEGGLSPKGGRHLRELPGGRVEPDAEVLDCTIAGDDDDAEGKAAA